MSDSITRGATHQGKVCRKCGSTLRYVVSKRCVPCQIRLSKEGYKRAYAERNKNNIERYHANKQENHTDISWRVNIAYRNARQRSMKFGRPFNITKEYLQELYFEQGCKCPISGRDFVLTLSEEFKTHPDSPSLDRVDNDKGYVQGNVRFVTYQVNTALNQFGEDSLIELCKNILENYHGR